MDYRVEKDGIQSQRVLCECRICERRAVLLIVFLDAEDG